MNKDQTPIPHTLVPKHTHLNEKERDELLAKYNINLSQLPGILKNDPAIKHLGLKTGDIIKIERASRTAKRS